MIKTKLAALIAGIAALAFSGAASATLLTNNTGYTGPTLQLGAFTNGQYNFTFGPVALPGGITFTRDHSASNSGNGAVVGQGFYGLSSNGSFDQNPVYIGLDGANATGTFTLAAPVSSIGFFFNYAPGSGADPIITALDSLGNVIDSYDLAVLAPISTPGGLDQFEFRGISESTADIASFQFSGSYLLATGTANGAVVPSIPEPANVALLMAGLGLVGVAARRRKA
ncbi:MAG: PEP-CTERM sorting domain-containing protein [Burkholderiaceae bacterium]